MSSQALRSFFPGLLLLVTTAPLHAEWRCDCSQTVANCSATVELEGNGIVVRSDHKECSRVDYIVEGQPFVTVAIDGEGKEAWLPQTSAPQIVVRGCSVCRDNLLGAKTAAGQEPSTGTKAQADTRTPEETGGPVVRFDPVYPQNARERRIEGYVNLNVVVNPDGTVRSAAVAEANPPRVFDQAAVASVRRWRYAAAGPDAGTRSRLETVVFRLPKNYRAGRAGASDSVVRDFNQCIRVAHDGGALLSGEVLLENVCEQALILHVCSAGGHGRLTCGPWGDQGTLLVRSGDPRSGSRLSMYRDQTRQTFIYSERVSVPRPGNARYWWLACDSRDTTCNDAGVRWRGLYDGRPTSVNPGESDFVRVARSL
jgi:TonB family protein